MISLIAALDINGCIGKEGDLPWYYPEDLKYFRRLTLNHRVLMGRKTFDSILARRGSPLPQRTNIVVTRNKDFNYPNITIITDLNKFLKEKHLDEVFIIGGREVYKSTLPYADRLYLTHIKKVYFGDVFFPEYEKECFSLVSKEDIGELEFAIYERNKKC